MKALLYSLILLAMGAPVWGASLGQNVEKAQLLQLEAKQEGERIVYYGSNRHRWAPLHLVLDFPFIDNLRPDQSIPAKFVLKPGETRRLVILETMDRQRRSEVRASSRYGLGDPNILPDAAPQYVLPWAHGKRHQMVQGYFGSFSHIGEYAQDFDHEEGEGIHSARAGLVMAVKQDEFDGGIATYWADKANYVEILHDDGTWAQYAHLVKDGARVKEGDRVQAGDLIGLAGHTGWARGPHLHFSIRQADWSDSGSHSMPVKFTLQGGKVEELKEGRRYAAWQPGKPAFDETDPASARAAVLGRAKGKSVMDGKVATRQEEVEGRIFLFARNGKPAPQWVSLGFRTLDGCAANLATPVAKTLCPGEEAMFLWLDRVEGSEASWQLSYRWRPAEADCSSGAVEGKQP
jgi:murein DD-endopeptidase MepM/ murein hydrolase activator NlpD